MTEHDLSADSLTAGEHKVTLAKLKAIWNDWLPAFQKSLPTETERVLRNLDDHVTQGYWKQNVRGWDLLQADLAFGPVNRMEFVAVTRTLPGEHAAT